MESDKAISVEGHEGLHFDGKMFHFDADEDVVISSSEVSNNDVTSLDILVSSKDLVTIPRTMCIKILKESPRFSYFQMGLLAEVQVI